MAILALGFLVYFAVLMALFFWVRAYTWTEEEALPAKPPVLYRGKLTFNLTTIDRPDRKPPVLYVLYRGYLT